MLLSLLQNSAFPMLGARRERASANLCVLRGDRFPARSSTAEDAEVRRGRTAKASKPLLPLLQEAFLSRISSPSRFIPFLLAALFWAPTLTAMAQAPPSIQFFMPDGSLPPRELRFTLTSDGGLVETFFTDSKGRFLITRREGLRPDAAYTVTIRGDGRTFDTTTVSFKFYGNNSVYYIPIFLRPLESSRQPPPGVIDLSEMDRRAPKEARDAYDNGMRAAAEGRMNDAVTELKRSLGIYPRNFRALNDLAVILMTLNRLDESAEMFQRAVEIAPRVHYARLNLAIVRTKQGKYKEAIELLDRLHKEHSDVSEVKIALADALMAVNRLDEAEPLLRAALENPKLTGGAVGDARYKLGLLLNRKQNYSEAAKELALAEAILPNSAQIRLQYGGALLQLKQLDEAERELLASYRLGGARMGGAQMLLGDLYFIQKKYEKAMRAYEQYLADVPKAPNASDVRAVIERIKEAGTAR